MIKLNIYQISKEIYETCFCYLTNLTHSCSLNVIPKYISSIQVQSFVSFQKPPDVWGGEELVIRKHLIHDSQLSKSRCMTVHESMVHSSVAIWLQMRHPLYGYSMSKWVNDCLASPLRTTRNLSCSRGTIDSIYY